MHDPTAFLHIKRQKLPLRPPAKRVRDWDYIGEAASQHARSAVIQASRCMDCGVPFCQSNYGCPVQNLIPDWNTLVAEAKWQEALSSLHVTNNFPEFTGFLCPAPCESACVLNREQAPVTIKDIELQIIERGFAEGWVRPLPPQHSRGKSVAIVGSGPAGLAAAQQLRRLGYEVTVFERGAKPGGLLRYGIPDFKMAKHIIDRRLQQLEQEGIVFRCGISIGDDLGLDDLRGQFDAVCLAIGAEQPRDIEVPGRHLAGVHQAMPFLVEQNKLLSGEEAKATICAKDKVVVVIGGGDTGSDCIGTALRQGARRVYEFSWNEQPPAQRSSDTPWPLPPLVLKASHSHEEGAERLWSIATSHLSGDEQSVRRLHTARVEKRGGTYELVPGDGEVLDVDLVILAIGFGGVAQSFLAKHPNLKAKANGALSAGADYMTSLPGVFATGDARLGASLIVWAIAEGRKAAAQIHRYLS